MITITIGPAVTGEDFYDREETIKEMWEVLRKGTILLKAPRRVGKTSLLLHLCEDPQPNFQVVYVTVEDLADPGHLAAELVYKASQVKKDGLTILKGMLSTFVKNVDELALWQVRLKLREHLGKDWKTNGKTALLEMLEPDKRLVLIIDELPLMILNMKRQNKESAETKAIDLLGWLRKLRMDPDTGKRLSMIITGSIGIERVVSSLKATRTINDLTVMEIGAFRPDIAQNFVIELFKTNNIKINQETMKTLLEEVDPHIPIFLQIMVKTIRDEVREHPLILSPELVHQCYENKVHGPEYRVSFEDYYERLDRYHSPEGSSAAKRILRELALSEKGLKKSTVEAIYVEELGKVDKESFDQLIDVLENDFYIERGDVLRFKTKWLRDWWRRYHA